MEFTNEFTVPVPIDDAFAVLTDLERVAPCMPGAQLTDVEGDTYTGRIKVKVGPMSLTYQGTARLVDVDADAYRAGIEARGSDQRGGGTANADVTASLEAVGDAETKVVVTTDINVTGRPAQFGRGVMADVGAKIIDRFSACLVDELGRDAGSDSADQGPEEGETATQPAEIADEAAPVTASTPAARQSGDVAAASSGATAAAAGQPSASAPSSAGASGRTFAPPREDALDLMDVAGEATAKRLAPIAAVVALVLVVWWWRRGD